MSKFDWSGIKKTEFNGKMGIWRTVGGRRIFISDGQDLATAMKLSGKFSDANALKELRHVDITDRVRDAARPLEGKVTVADKVLTVNGETLVEDGKNVIFETEIQEDEEETANWFRNQLWGYCHFQKSVKYPQKIHSADLFLTKSHPFLNGSTVEIKNVHSSRLDGITKNIKRGDEQSSNILLDITHAKKKHPKDAVIKEAKRYFDNPKHSWIDALLIRDGDDLLIALKRK